MSVHMIYRCDVCGCDKRPADVWFESRPSSTGIELMPFSGDPDNEHICSSRCLAVRINRFEEALRQTPQMQEEEA